MVIRTIPFIAIIVLLASCSTLKPLDFTSSRLPATTNPVTRTNETKFIEEIAITPPSNISNAINKPVKETVSSRGLHIEETTNPKVEDRSIRDLIASRSNAGIENVSKVQLKYAVLLNTELESLPSKELLESVDTWYGVRYRTGGNTKSGVDCSGFTVAVYAAIYGITLPRVSRDQYRTSRHISSTELQEGDLLFFDTRGRGSVSHVGIYLGNNRFIHASVSKGVMVSGMFEPYYLQRFVGAGRFDNKEMNVVHSNSNSSSGL
jgi:lipoprotein Spr